MSRLAIVGAEVLNPGEDAPVECNVLVEEGRFVELLEPAKPLLENWEQFDASGKLLIPGLINPHMHGHANLLRGLCNAWCLEMSLVNGPWMAGIRDPDTIYTSTLLGAYEMLSQGVTACYDLAFEYPMPTKEGAQAMAAAYRDAG
ncbi:MAG: amidohydrolase family protein, partial [Verrucomicrobiota bacterium]